MKQAVLFCFLFVISSGCSSLSDGEVVSGVADETRGDLLADVNDWGYQLQGINVDEIAASGFDLVVVDYSSDGSDGTAFAAEEVAAMKGSGNSEKLVIAYLSIGEAEDYRYYFDAGATYMEGENPEWPGNFKVRYWEEAWQEVVETYLDRLLNAGFDGAYLDIIDGYEYFGSGGDSGLNRESAAADMAELVLHIAEYARDENPDFLIFPQNGSNILNDSGMEEEYLEAIDGIGAESTFYFGDEEENNDLNIQDWTVANLDRFREAGKVVLSIDYLTEPDKIDDYYSRASERGFIPYATVRMLDQLAVPDGHEPD